ncbi:MAG: hypothetical protein HQ483_01735 [Rhodospirillales bacterium]|nr:hypothetical protein [Rhodospirillales bacterium]
MGALLSITGHGSKALSYLLGVSVLGLAGGVALTEVRIADIIAWSDKIFGGLFVSLFCALVYMAILAIVRVQGRSITEPGVRIWFEAGLQAASAIATLALTYTLLGISLGIGGLAGQDLNPETVSGIIRSLTENFSMAFMTTVVGLPVSAVLRAILMVAHSRAEERARIPLSPLTGD